MMYSGLCLVVLLTVAIEDGSVVDVALRAGNLLAGTTHHKDPVGLRSRIAKLAMDDRRPAGDRQ